MKNSMKLVVGAFLALFVCGIVIADTTTTVTNRNQVITIKTLDNVATDIKDADMYQDFSIYPERLGQSGKIIRFYDVGKCGVSSTGATMLPAVPIKDNIMVRNGYYKVLVPTGVITTNNVLLNTASDIVASATNSIHAAEGTVAALVPVGTAGTSVQATAERLLKLAITDGTPTVGRIMVVLDCELAP